MLVISLKIGLLIGDTKLKEIDAMGEAFRFDQRASVALIGPPSLGPTLAVSSWLSIPSIDRALIGYSVTSPQLTGIPNFVRTPLTAGFPEKLMAKLIKGL